jgi:CRISPR system Cascade subunit CasC
MTPRENTMAHFLEFHLIQNFAPSNLNRDDTGSPKDALFGGHRRARISSQCLKRSVRLLAAEQNLLSPEHRGVRTKQLKSLLVARLAQRDAEEAAAKIEAALASAGLTLKVDGKTEYLLFLGEGEVSALACLIDQHWDEITVSAEKKSKKDARAAAGGDVGKKLKKLLNGGKAVDVALFGRMLADMPAVNQDAACQVAHAISTHRVEREFDYFTAVDDKEEGVGMIGQVEFNSATFYRYAVVDLDKLSSNLQKDRDLVLAAVKAFTLATARAVPSGKQNTFAAHNLPQFVAVCLRHDGPMNLANAFEKPVAPRRDLSLTEQSVAKLAEHEGQFAAIYGSSNDRWLALDLSGQWPKAKGAFEGTLAEFAAQVQALAAEALPVRAA